MQLSHRFASALVVALLAACGGKTTSGRASGPGEPPKFPGIVPYGHVEAGRDVHAIDWLNRPYTSVDVLPEGKPIQLVNGEAQIDYDEETHGWVMANPPLYGDITGDGVDEAIQIVIENGGGTGKFDYANVYAAKDGQPVLLGVIPGGDRADGGLADLKLVGDGKIRVERMASEHSGACCPDHKQIEIWAFDGKAFVEDQTKREYYEDDFGQGG